MAFTRVFVDTIECWLRNAVEEAGAQGVPLGPGGELPPETWRAVAMLLLELLGIPRAALSSLESRCG